jgi:hypothetical protein
VQKGTFVAGIAFRASKGPGRPRMGPGGTARPTRPPTNNLTTTGVVNETGTNGPLHPKVAPFDKTQKIPSFVAPKLTLQALTRSNSSSKDSKIFWNFFSKVHSTKRSPKSHEPTISHNFRPILVHTVYRVYLKYVC